MILLTVLSELMIHVAIEVSLLLGNLILLSLALC